jgi:hypothetical protein
VRIVQEQNNKQISISNTRTVRYTLIGANEGTYEIFQEDVCNTQLQQHTNTTRKP